MSPLHALRQGFTALHAGDDLRRIAALARRLVGRERVVLPEGPPGPPGADLQALLTGDDRSLDVALGACAIAQEDEPHLDVGRAVDTVDAWACQLRLRLRGAGSDPRARQSALDRFFFEELGFSAAPSRTSRYDEDRLADLLLPHVLRRRRGHCVGLSTLYLALGYRAGLPLFGVSAPGHFFVRWEGEGLRRNIELTSRGAEHPDAYYMERFGIRPALVDRGVYLQSLRRREVLVEILNNRANFYWDRGDEARAMRDLDRVVNVSHNFSRAYVGRGFLALQRGALGVARRDLEKALEIDADDPRAHLLLGQVHLRAGDVPAAEAAFERATEADPTSALAQTYLGRVYELRGQHDRALEWHQQATRTDPRCHTAWNHLGLARQAIGDAAGARQAFAEARRVQPANVRARENLVLLTRGGFDTIAWTARPAFWSLCRQYEARLRQAPDAAAIRAAYARFLLGAGLRLERGLQVARELVHAAETPHHLELLGQLQARRGDATAARESLRRAIELDQEHGGALKARLEAQLTRLERDRAT